MKFLLPKEEIASENLSELITDLFEQNGHVIFLCDETLLSGFFDEFVDELTDYELEPIEIAASKKNSRPALFFIKIKVKEDLEHLLDFIIQTLLMNLDQNEDGYFIHGFGKIDDLKIAVQTFKELVIAKDTKNKFIFRWYDPRVLVYLPAIIDKKSERIESFLGDWHFVFFNGLYVVKTQEKRALFPLTFTNDESAKLDLIELSNTVIKQSLIYDEKLLIRQDEILESLHQAIRQYGILHVTDLIAYGMYSVILHKDFMRSSRVSSIISHYWIERLEANSFTTAMDYLEENQYSQVTQECEEG
nr:hypothetical protein [Acinetobacter sp.]